MKPLSQFEISPSIKDFLDFCTDREWQLTLVGGIIRDWILYEKIGFDWDFELRSSLKISTKEAWQNFCEDMKEFSHSRRGQYEVFPQGVVKLIFPDHHFEIALPRIDVYDTKSSSYGHGEFEIEFDLSFSLEKTLLRRDFTCNSLYAGWNGESFVLKDPAGGIKDIEQRKLRTVNPDFAKDPVRFWRTFRFSLVHGLSLCEELETVLAQMQLEKSTLKHFLDEVLKCPKPRILFDSIKDFIEKKDMKLPEWWGAVAKQWPLIPENCDNEDLPLVWGMQLEERELKYYKKNGFPFKFKDIEKGFTWMRKRQSYSTDEWRDLPPPNKMSFSDFIKWDRLDVLMAASKIGQELQQLTIAERTRLEKWFPELVTTVKKCCFDGKYHYRDEFKSYLTKHKPQHEDRYLLSLYFHFYGEIPAA